MSAESLATHGSGARATLDSPPVAIPPPIQAAIARLGGQPAAAWLDAARALLLQQDATGATAVLEAARARHGEDGELQLALAGARWQARDHAGAQALLDDLLERQPDHAGAAFALANLHLEQVRPDAAATALQALFGRFRQPADLVLRASRMLAEASRKQAAAELCEAAIAAGSGDAGLHLHTAALQGQLGAFERSRRHYLRALELDPRTVDFGAAYGLASITRYSDPGHPDLARFEALLERPGTTQAARASLLFALGKASDDLGDFARAARHLRAANDLVDHRDWSRKNWRRVVEARLRGSPWPQRRPEASECIPVFVVGPPRSGTTLLAELLGRSPEVTNRGELDWLPHLAEQAARLARPDGEQLDGMAQAYLSRLRQGDSERRWFIDKQPLNFLNADLIRALFPQARIIHCRRNSRDTALSIWSQHFESTEYRFAYDFDDIAAVLGGCARLMDKARREAGPALLEVRYEDLVRDPGGVVGGLADALGLAPFDCADTATARSVIGTASLWQARQPIYTRAVGRWRAYAGYVPELLRFADD
jgi:tetratricopeptide (TPR) repeat protein